MFFYYLLNVNSTFLHSKSRNIHAFNLRPATKEHYQLDV